MRPGLITGRRNDKRCGETFLKYFCCCYPQVTAREIGRAMRVDAENQANSES